MHNVERPYEIQEGIESWWMDWVDLIDACSRYPDDLECWQGRAQFIKINNARLIAAYMVLGLDMRSIDAIFQEWAFPITQSS